MITWVMAIISLFGNYLNCRKIRSCFIVWILVNAGWSVYDIGSGLYSRAVLDLVQIGFCVFGLIEWK